VPFYEKFMDMELVDCKRGEGVAVLMRKGDGYPGKALLED
jgi:hypothetical protein